MTVLAVGEVQKRSYGLWSKEYKECHGTILHNIADHIRLSFSIFFSNVLCYYSYQRNRYRILRRKETKRDKRLFGSKIEDCRCQFRKHYEGRSGHKVGTIYYTRVLQHLKQSNSYPPPRSSLPTPIDYKVYWHQSERIRPRHKPCGFSFYWNYRMMNIMDG